MFRTLEDLKKDEKKEKKEKKKTDSYTGGEKSGLAVENPDDIHGVMNKAKENSKKMPPSQDKPDINCKITLYKNGFTVDDGEFRDYNDPANKKFMAELNKGNVPEELKQKYPQGLRVGLSDRRKDTFELPPPPKYVAFSGQGTSLGGAPTLPVAATTNVEGYNTNARPPTVDNSKPKTKILIRLHTGKTEEIEVNLHTRVSEIYSYVRNLTLVTGEFELIAGFPPKPLKDLSSTVEQAGLEDSKVTQKLV